MKATFLNHEYPLLTVILQCTKPEVAIERIRKSHGEGAEAFGLQVESLERIYHNQEYYQRIFAAMEGKPVYVTNYRTKNNSGRSDEELAKGLLRLADYGAVLCDVMGDLFSEHPEQLTENKEAIAKQIDLIEQLHNKGAEVLMSSHVHKFISSQRVLDMALEQQRRGADIIKIVTSADTMEQQIENLRITNLLKKELAVPFLFLSGGESSIHRRLGPRLGCCMYLCVYEHDEHTTKAQPLLRIAKAVRDEMGF